MQEEPANLGAWPFIALNLPEHLDGRVLRVVSRKASASPAVGSQSADQQEQRAIVESALG